MNYKKIILVGFISAFVAVLTSIMGVAGTIIGSVISSVLYNMLTEALENPVNRATFSADFEWDIAYVFPIAVIALIQLLLIFALLAEAGMFPKTFINVYLSLQHLANNNLYRLLGIALLVISAYPLVLKPDFVKKEHGFILVFVAIIFLARGFVDLGNTFTDIYDDVFIMFDLPIAVIAFVLLLFVIVRILLSAKNSEAESSAIRNNSNMKGSNRTINESHYSKGNKTFERTGKKTIRVKNSRNDTHVSGNKSKVNFKGSVGETVADEELGNQAPIINKSSDNIQFESNDLLDDYRK